MEITRQNYFSKEASAEYLSVSQYHDFCGTMGYRGCEARALAKLRSEVIDEPSVSQMQGKYADAYFAGELCEFKELYPQIFAKSGQNKGELKSEYKTIENVINRIKRDSLFMTALEGQKQTVFTAELFGAKWKCMLDFYQPKKAIIDLKIIKDLRETMFVKDYGRMLWILYWGYEFQGAIYQAIVEKVTGDKLPFFIAAASKDESPDIELIGIDDKTLREVLFEVENNVKRIIELKAGEVEPDRCGVCDYCRMTKVLTKPIHYSELI